MKNLVYAGTMQEDIFHQLKNIIHPGVTTLEIYDFVFDCFEKNDFEVIDNSHPITININNTVYHGVPGSSVLNEGDVVTVDICFMYKKGILDGAFTYAVGSVSEAILDLIQVNKNAINSVLDIIESGIYVKDIVKFLSDFVASHGFYLLPHGMGHGIGHNLHDPPFISLNDFTDFNYKFKVGDIFTLEPILLLKKDNVFENNIGEGIVAKDNVSSQFEITIIINDLNSAYVFNKALIN